eukprot:3406470-Ditylum_brightwellii.AAC.1
MSQQGTKLAVLGWGKDGSDGQNTAMFHEAEVELWDLVGCITSYGSDRLGDVTIFVSNPGMTNSCKGESGGPLLYNNHHGGIAQ